MDGLDLLWGIGSAVCVAFMAYGGWLCLSIEHSAEKAEAPAEVNSSHAASAPGHSLG